MQSNARLVHARAILGNEFDRLQSTKVLVVGAGGIGCELLKNIVLSGFQDITLLDLDTIDLSNLNRQFLFRKKDVKKPKALVAAKTASAFNPAARITPLHANIKEATFDAIWFSGFDIVLNALDNLGARRHVNQMCVAAGVPLVESGTAGYLGQVQPLLKDQTECFDCIAKPVPKSFPVCTIRSTPSQPIHCIVWAKNYLMPQLFGEDENESELDEAERHGENALEISSLRKQAQAFRVVREALRSSSSQPTEAAHAAFCKVYDADIRDLLIMKDMWRAREPPVPLDINSINSGTFTLRGVPIRTASATTGCSNGHVAPTLRDQKVLSLSDNVNIFVDSCVRLAARLRQGEDTIGFDKDDDDALDFVTAASNLRSAAYGISTKTRWEVKEMAGNIIPAIATTNAIVAGLIVLQALQLLRLAKPSQTVSTPTQSSLRNVIIQTKREQPIGSSAILPPNPDCVVCRDLYVTVQCDPVRLTLGGLLRKIMPEARDVTVYEAQRVLADPDFNDNHEKTLESLKCTVGTFISIVDDEDEVQTISIALAALPPLLMPDDVPMPGPKQKAKPVAPASPTPPLLLPPTPAKKRAREDDDLVVIDEMPTNKKARTEHGSHATPSKEKSATNGRSPSKAERLEEDGLVIVEGAEIIIID
ncbi:hypothetical protein BKA62DRAFT_825615 [Auriculariales sp. MPI-PUGE-AT-0066]|nr:hypothetical protein BKA62DRAFT_825615 [Auriculariales sp. MPI-PUGE-AT-0066]